ncbi:hypothetical protein [Paremcibacter congregatus]|jgi:hypothetical protein|uniref:Uncharacterized protein n=1 Tax=Paremcibacter congregatus TaxID=2043170 RepID=A0A2G4YLW5_9PROT|nr:hypothetical protein [Paremcibacter congregatus]PHZ83314.1 hypothetical protein CRD36_17260 [Paremcibacter congregatus]QDE28212.1 hypothetical protein FIV45_13525 [Paremcibacter congregatus]|tara:strand:+ start:142 stop:327 length:186 start_codon:yes stop_codon:yes gene_type:complete
MTCIVSTLLHDSETTRRVARVLLKHIGPKDRTEAYSILHSRIGVYTYDTGAITQEIDSYFN